MLTATIPYLKPDRVIVSGRLCAGKDFVAEHSGHTVYGFADPMYRLAEHFLGTTDKSLPGVRRFLQKIGAWGRGEVSEDYPVTVERRKMVEELRTRGHEITGMGSKETWKYYAVRPDEAAQEDGPSVGPDLGEFWIELLAERIERAPEDRIAITNGRFPNEIRYFLGQMDFTHFHVMCSQETRKERLEERGETLDPEAEADVTEQLAAELDRLALTEEQDEGEMVKDLPTGARVGVFSGNTVVWNDDCTPPQILKAKDN